MLKDVQYNPKSNFNLFSTGKAIKEGWKLSGDQESLVLMKGNAKLVFKIEIVTKNDVIFCAYLWREYGISTLMASMGTTMSIERIHMMTKHHDEEQTHRIATELGWPSKKGLMMPCEACSIRKARQLRSMMMAARKL